MGMIVRADDPIITTPHQRALGLMAQKDSIEAQLKSHLSILTSNNVTMATQIVDAQGFPRADIDIVAVRSSRVRVIELRNDLKKVVDDLAVALEDFHKAEPVPPASQPATTSSDRTANSLESGALLSGPLKPFARVDGVAPRSPASVAGLLRGDLVLSFGPLDSSAFLNTSSLQPLAELVAAHENSPLPVQVVRQDNTTLTLTFVPRSGWGGRGLLGCHIVPYTSG